MTHMWLPAGVTLTVGVGATVGVLVGAVGAAGGVAVVSGAFSMRITFACSSQCDREPAMNTRSPRFRPAAVAVADCFVHVVTRGAVAVVVVTGAVCATVATLLVTLIEIVMPVPTTLTVTVGAVAASTCCAAVVLPVSMAVAGAICPAMAAPAAEVLPVRAVVPVVLAATFVTFVPPDSHHTLNEPLAARITTNFLVARTTVPRSKASLL